MASLRCFRVFNEADLQADVAQWLDEANFSPGDLQLARDSGVLTMPFAHFSVDEGFEQGELVSESWLSRRYRVPYLRCLLTVREVVSVRPDLHEIEEPGQVEHLDWDPATRVLSFPSSCDSSFEVLVGSLDVALEVTDEVSEHRMHTLGRHFGWEGVGPID